MAEEERPVLDRVEQRRRYGVDCGDCIRFEAGSWAPGGEHMRQLTVRNVSQRTVKFKYELPRTKYFSMNFPTVITLSPGMLTTLDVAFRPVKLEEYDDFVGFSVHVIEGGVAAVTGRFRVPVVARIAALKVEIPFGLDFGFCPTREMTSQRFMLHNCGQIDALFDWTVPAAGEHGSPFAVHPESGEVKAGASVELTASFLPSSASVYVTTTACTVRPNTEDQFGQTLVETMKISGISKFTHLSVSEAELNFGEVLVGAPNTSRAPTEKEFVLRNRSLVRASFSIENVENDHEPRFFFSPLNGVVEAESTVTIKVRYTPLSAGTFTCDHFDIYTPGGNCVRLTCKGRAIGPMLGIWRKNLASNFVPTRSVNFQDVPVGGKIVSRVISLRNESLLEVFFHFDAQHDGVFHFDRINGKIAPNLDLNVTISFCPPHAGNFYRRFFLLIHNQSTRYLDVLGTGFDEKTRPSPFQQAHIDAYRLRVAAGLGRFSPDQLEAYHEEHGDALFLQGALRQAENEDAPSSKVSDGPLSISQLPPPSQILTRSGEASLADVEVCTEYFINIEEKENPIVAHGAFLDFGSSSIVQFPSKKLLLVTNNTHSKVTSSWRVAMAGYSSETGEAESVFQVFPPSSDIAAGATAEFRVAFQPTRANSYFFAELEAFVTFKSNRTFRLVNVETFTPPWCVVTKVCGNTFSSPTEQFLPKVIFRLAKNKVHFPPCYLGDTVFQTIMIENASDTPAVFEFIEDPAEVFLCKPMCGYIEAKSFHLVAIRCTPRSVRKHTHFLQCVINNTIEKPVVLELTAICAVPQLSFQDIAAGQMMPSEAKVYVKPTAVGLESTRQIELINTSRVPLVYRWELPSKYSNVFRIKPKLGRLNGRESTSIEFFFTPTEIREYLSRFRVAVKSISIPLNQHKNSKSKIPVLQELTVRLQTKGTIGAILFEPEALKFETILVNSNAKQTFFIINTADCDLVYSLRQSMKAKIYRSHVSQSAGSYNEECDASTTGGKLVFSEAEGCVPAQSRKKITATFFPTSAGQFTFEVTCVIGNETEPSPYDTCGSQRKHAVCVIEAEAAFPTIEIQDLRVPGISTQLAWHQFQCNEINEYLAAPLSDEEEKLGHRAATMGGPDVPESSISGDEFSLNRFSLPFSPASFGSRPEKVFMKLRNPGNLVVQYHLRYPKEGNVEIEHWAETGAPSTEELRLNAIIDSKVFGVSPRQATLLPHQSIVLTLSYSYTSDSYDGKHHLPLFLEVDKGRKAVLDLRGTTLSHKDPKLFLPTSEIHLSPVMIGEFRQEFLPPPALRGPGTTDDGNSDQYVAASMQKAGPPVQQLEVFNRGESALRLEIECTSFKRVNAANYGYPVLACRNTSEIIPSKCSVFLNIEFNPIQVGIIEASVWLTAHGLMAKGYHEKMEVFLVAAGYHPNQLTLQQAKEELWASAAPPKMQLLATPDLPIRFVSDYVDFGHVSMHSCANQLVVLQNETKPALGDTVISPAIFAFEWDSAHPLVSNGMISFSPKRGELMPGEQVLIRVSIRAEGDAVVVNHDVACLITYCDDSKEANSNNNTAAGSSTRPRSQVPSASSASTVRMSVINRSIATQEAVVEKGKRSVGRSPALTSSSYQPGTQPPSAMAKRSSSQKSLTRNSPADNSVMMSSDSRQLEALILEQPATPLFVRIYAHVLPQVVMEKVYPHSELKKLPLLTTKEIPRAIPVSIPETKDVKTPSTSVARDMSTQFATKTITGREAAMQSKSRGIRPIGSSSKLPNGTPDTPAKARYTVIGDDVASAKCRDVLYDVMEVLVMDVLNSSTIQEVLQDQLMPLPRSDHALVHATTEVAGTSHLPESLYHDARQNDDCQAIIGDIMENTVFNVLQELFYGDLEQELQYVPRKEVFPNAVNASPSQRPAVGTSAVNFTDTQATIA